MNLKNKGYLYFLCLVGFAIASCKDNNDAPVPLVTANINVMHLIPDAGSFNYYDNGTRQNSYKLGYTHYSGYITVAAGQQLATLKDTLYNTFYSNSLTLTSNAEYTLMVTGQALKGTIAGVLLPDAVTYPTTVNSKVRFANMAPNTPAVDVYFNKVAVSNASYKGVSAWALADTGSVSVKINLAGTSKVVYGPVTVPLVQGGAYTFYAYGLYGTTTGASAFSLNYITN